MAALSSAADKAGASGVVEGADVLIAPHEVTRNATDREITIRTDTDTEFMIRGVKLFFFCR